MSIRVVKQSLARLGIMRNARKDTDAYFWGNALYLINSVAFVFFDWWATPTHTYNNHSSEVMWVFAFLNVVSSAFYYGVWIGAEPLPIEIWA